MVLELQSRDALCIPSVHMERQSRAGHVTCHFSQSMHELGGQSVVLTSLFRQALMALQLAANTISTSTGTKGDNPRVLCMMLASSRQNISL